MYAYLKGKLTYKSPAQVYVDVNGVGYEVNISLNTYSQLQHLDECKLYTYLQVKEDGHTLFGFFDRPEKEMFVMLIGVSGIGAATARMMLSSLKPDEINRAPVAWAAASTSLRAAASSSVQVFKATPTTLTGVNAPAAAATCS